MVTLRIQDGRQFESMGSAIRILTPTGISMLLIVCLIGWGIARATCVSVCPEDPRCIVASRQLSSARRRRQVPWVGEEVPPDVNIVVHRWSLGRHC
ncbi:hypothetical protein K438DRAFT_737986 [Mycena galopus ATCC 62051]|nr:hypothetical protein K438DRAFT_737986 [Mycena galopus ATCC 62051]